MNILLRFFKLTGKWYTDITFPAKNDEWNAAMDETEEYLRAHPMSKDMVILAIPQRRDGLQITEDVPKLFNADNNLHKYRILYRDIDSNEVAHIFVECLNQFYGADIPHLQVLRSAAGYYIGTLSCADEKDAEIYPNGWEPYSRDSQEYWSDRKDAEKALFTGKYSLKF